MSKKTKSMFNEKVVVVKLGTDDRPASDKDIKKMAKILKKAGKKSKLKTNFIVTHHAVTFEVF